MTTPTEEVYVVEHIVKDELGCWWKPVFTHTNLAVALGKLMDQGAHYFEGYTSPRLRVYKGTTTVIGRSDAADVHARLLQECKVVGHGRAHADANAMVGYVTDAWVAIGWDCLTDTYAKTVEDNRNRLGTESLVKVERSAIPPLEVLNREFEYAAQEDILLAEAALLKLSDLWAPKALYFEFVPKEKKVVSPLVAVEENRPCYMCGTKDVKAFEEPGDSLCVGCREGREEAQREVENEEGRQ
jgi:hypothetical protein